MAQSNTFDRRLKTQAGPELIHLIFLSTPLLISQIWFFFEVFLSTPP